MNQTGATPATAGTNPITPLDRKRVRDPAVRVGNESEVGITKSEAGITKSKAGITKQSPLRNLNGAWEVKEMNGSGAPFCLVS